MSTAALLGQDPGWIVLVKGLLIFVFCVVCTLMAVWGERRIVARMQMRIGRSLVLQTGRRRERSPRMGSFWRSSSANPLTSYLKLPMNT